VQPGQIGERLTIGNVATAAFPAGPGGRTRSCVRCGIYLVSEGEARYALLLHGVPGTGKTHTVGYLLGQLPQATIVILTGVALDMIGQACSVARLLQPSVVIVEDVDLIAEQRGPRHGPAPAAVPAAERDGRARRGRRRDVPADHQPAGHARAGARGPARPGRPRG
jgi:hypothetical protein